MVHQKVEQIDIFASHKPGKNETSKSNTAIYVVTDDEDMIIIALRP